MKRLVLLVFLIMFSCSNPADVSIYDDLPIDNLKSMVKTDSLYAEIYESTELMKKFSSKLDVVNYSGITYQMLYDYRKESDDLLKWNKIKEKYRLEWEKEYSIYDKKFDSIINYWDVKYENERSIDKYIKVEPVGLKTDYYTYTSGIRDASIRFRLTNLSGKTISGTNFRYKIVAKVDDDGDEGVYGPKYDGDTSYIRDWNGCRSTAVFNNSTSGLWKVDYSDEDIVGGKSLKTLLETHNIYVIPYKVRVGNKNIEALSLNDIPFEIKMYKEYIEKKDSTFLTASPSAMADIYKAKVINEYLNLDFEIPGVYDAFDEFRNQELKDKFPLVSEYINSFDNKNPLDFLGSDLFKELEDIFKD